MQIPAMEWLRKWLEVAFYKEGERCSSHHKQFNTIYCSSCMERPICLFCWDRNHSEELHQGNRHRILKVVTASHRAAIEVKRMVKFVDASEIQVYSINGHNVFHLHPKAEIRAGAIDEPCCETCRTKMKKPGYRFCSIACKFAKEGQNMAIKLEPKSGSSSPSSDIDFEIGETGLASAEIPNAIKLPKPKTGTIKLKKTAKRKMNDSDQCSSFVSLRKRSRKGIPHRAPLQ